MKTLTRFHWHHTGESFLLLIIRVILGIVLLAKGIFFISHAQYLRELILHSRFEAGVGFLTAYITVAHFLGGVFLILGLLTRVGVLLQIPVLLGAIFFILPSQGRTEFGAEGILSVIVLALLVIVLLKGSGETSMDTYLKKHSL